VAGDKRELILDLLARDKTGAATKKASDNIKGVGASADKAGKQTDRFGKQIEQAARDADELGDQAKQTAGAISKLDREIALATAELGVLAAAFARTNDAAERLDISKGIRRGENDIRRLSKSKNLLEGLLPDPAPLAKTFMQRLGTGLASAGGSVATMAGGSVGPVVGGAIGVAAAPVLVSTLGSALSAGAGLGVLGAGIALAVKNDPKIQEAGKLAATRFMESLGKRAAVLNKPIMESIGVLSDAADRMVDDLGDAFNKLGPAIVPLVKDVASAANTLTDALGDVAEESKPAMAGLGDALKLVSDGAASLLRSVADGSPEAASNMVLLAGAIRDVITQTGGLLNTLNQLSNNPFITGPLLPMLRKHYQEAADASGTFKKHTEGATEAMKGAEGAAKGEKAALVELSTAIKAQTDPVFAFLEAQKQLKTAQKNAADATKDHGRKSKEAKEALRELAQAAIDLEGKAGALGDTFNGELTPELKATLRAAGLSEKQIRDLGAQFRAAKRDGDRFAKNYKANVSANTKKALTDIRAVQRIVNSLDGRTIDIAMKVTGVTNVSKARSAINKQYQARASGGPISKDTPYWVGEAGPELVFPNHDGRILSASASRGYQARARMGPTGNTSGGGGGGTLRLELVGEQGMVSMVRRLIRTANLLQDA
jgi:hypothetical protein